MKTAKFFAVATMLMALLFVGMQAYAQGNGVYGPWRYSAPYHLPTLGSCQISCWGPFVLKDTDFIPKYQQPLPAVPGPKLPCPPPMPPRKVKPAMAMPPFGGQMFGPPMQRPLYPQGAMPHMPIRPTPCPGGYCPVS